MALPSQQSHSPTPSTARLFVLERDVDMSGISGVGVVAEGVEFTDGSAVIHWLLELSSTTLFEPPHGLADLEQISGHHGATRVVWVKGDEMFGSRAILHILQSVEGRLDSMQRQLGSIMTDQEHLEAGVTAIRDSVATAVAELKAQIAAGTPASALDFTTFDKLTTDEAAEATADAPPAPPAPPVA